MGIEIEEIKADVSFKSIGEFIEKYKKITSDGIFLQLDPPPPVRSNVQISIHVPGADEEISFTGKVFFSSPEKCGIFLVDLFGEKREKLERYVRIAERAFAEASASPTKYTATPPSSRPSPSVSEPSPPVDKTITAPETTKVYRPPQPSIGSEPPNTTTIPAPATFSTPRTVPLTIEKSGVREGDVSIKGNLSEKPLGEILLELYKNKEDGILEIMEEGRRRRIYFMKGSPVSVETQPIVHGECLGVMLLKTGKLTEEDLKESLSLMAKTGKKQGEVLIQMGLLSYSDLILALQQQTELIITRLLNIKSGRFTFFKGAGRDKKSINPPVDVPALLFRILKKRFKEFSKKEMEKLDQSFQTRYLSPNPSSRISPYEVKFTKQERKFWDNLVNGTKLMRDIYKMTNMTPVDTFSFIHAMHTLGILEFSEKADKDMEMEQLKVRLTKKLINMKEKNLFEVLDVHWTANSEKVERGYRRLMTEYSPAKLSPKMALPPDVENIRKSILSKIEEAYLILKDDVKRRSYRKSIMDLEKIRFSAELLMKQEEMALVRNDLETANDCHEKVVELMNGEDKRAYLKRTE